MHTDLGKEMVELFISHPEKRLLVQNRADQVVIRAPRNNFSPREKILTIHYLAAEGYIPERFQWLGDMETAQFSGLTWIVENPHEPDSTHKREMVYQVLRVIFLTGLVWLALISYAFLHAYH
jgi:hypothetical protein